MAFFFIRWSNWRFGYPTALFGSLGSFVLDELFTHQGFWYYSSKLLPGLWPNLTLNIGFYLAGTWVFIQHYPKTKGRILLWNILGEVILLSIELTLYLRHNMHYALGWHIGYSALANIILLLMLRWHFLIVEK